MMVLVQVFFEDVLARRRRAQLKWELTPIESIFSDQSDLRITFPQVLCCVFGHVLLKKGMHSTDAFDFFDSSGDGTLQAAEVYRMFKWAGITATARQLLSFIRAVDSDKDMQIDQGEFMAALRLPACSPKQAAHATKRRELMALDMAKRAEIDERVKKEITNLERERSERDQLARELREKQEQRVRAEMLQGGAWESCEPGDDSRPNPAVSARSARYRLLCAHLRIPLAQQICRSVAAYRMCARDGRLSF